MHIMHMTLFSLQIAILMMTLFSLQIAILMMVDNFDYCLFYNSVNDLYDTYLLIDPKFSKSSKAFV